LAAPLLDEALARYETSQHKVRLISEGCHRAGSWEHERRVVYKAEVMEEGTNTRFVVTNKPDNPEEIYDHYSTDLQCLNILSETGPVAAGRLAEETGLTTIILI
jgi:hypothetical protein